MNKINEAIYANQAKLNAIITFANDYVWPLNKPEDLAAADTLIEGFYEALYENEAFLSAAHTYAVAMADLTIPQLSLVFRSMASEEIKNTLALTQIIQHQLQKALMMLLG